MVKNKAFLLGLIFLVTISIMSISITAFPTVKNPTELPPLSELSKEVSKGSKVDLNTNRNTNTNIQHGEKASSGCITKWVWSGEEWMKADIYLPRRHKYFNEDGIMYMVVELEPLKVADGDNCLAWDKEKRRVAEKPISPGTESQSNVLMLDWLFR